MQVRELSIPHAYEMTPRQHVDDRGLFLEWYRFDRLQETVGHALELRQGNLSVSRRGVLRGIHFASVPLGQAKYVTAVSGSVLDFVVDIRVGSPTFGQWEGVVLDDVERKSVYLAEGLGHAFLALSDHAVVTYLVSDTYNRDREHGIDPFDPEIGLELPDLPDVITSPKDAEAPTLAEASKTGLLPSWEDCLAHYRRLDEVD
ncbi:dTDP-4-dehydrorhamnose 3,5-epimerase family protein [Agromyces sp. Soil535]|uniref:dTDP-4-dehydrorhamnose 3,5-epimerase family protein n=1 Tax=Agromyces sp. Soil535 TaxID=1736390 RepID=UPI0006F8DF46|nr:dTDP-4-dehydrorhamnose 3,5-epimerase [Agromyces sp. Soil535]KRE26033.1 dTDP-4-dehydrorhamnose 3,5-epimerase [Agromyces sp. Soil535]